MKKSTSLIVLIFFLGIINLYAQDTLTILHLNDTHSTLSSIGPRTNDLQGTQGEIARAATLIGLTKMIEPNVLTLHAGDLFIGDLFFNQYFGVAEFQLLNSLGLDAMAVGNHEWDLTPSTLYGSLQASFLPVAGFPLLSANTILEDPAVQPLKDYIHQFTLKQLGSIKVGIFGMTTPEANVFSQPSPAVISDDIVNIALAMVDSLTAKNCDVIILLSHLGLNLDKVIASYVPGINVIVGGHDHYLLETPVEVINPLGGTTYIVQAKSNYLYVGKLQLEVNAGVISLLNYQAIPLDESIPEEPTVAAQINTLIAGIEAVYGPVYTQQIGYAALFFKEEAADLFQPGVHDTPVGNLITDAFKWKTGTDIAIQAGGSTAQPLYQGPLVGADLFRTMGYGFNTINGLGYQLVKFNMTGVNLLAGLEFGLSNIELSDEFLIQVSGIEYVYDGTKPANSRLVSVKVNGVQINPVATYSVTGNELVLMVLDYLEIPVTDVFIYEGLTEFKVLSEYVINQGAPLLPKSLGRIANIPFKLSGSVAGAGWLNSPQGACFINQAVKGKLFFAFNVMNRFHRYSGNVLLYFIWPNFRFNSTGIDWFTIEEGWAQFKGNGKVNGQGNFGFLITAVNGTGNKDKLRITIWDKITGALVYDNFTEQQIVGGAILFFDGFGKEVAEEEVANLPTEFALEQNYPNPFNPTTNFEFRIAESGLVTLKIYDILGNEIAAIVNEELPAGNYKYQWNASGLASGVYLYRLQTGNYIDTKKLILMK